MDNYDLHYKAQLLADTHSKYKLARRIVKLEENLQHIGELSDGGEPEPSWHVSLKEDSIDDFVNNQKVYIINDQNE